jgi:hypothetical protein
MNDDLVEAFEESVATSLDAQQFGNLADGDDHSQAKDEAGDDRFGKELGNETEPHPISRNSKPTMTARPDARTMYSSDQATAKPPRTAAIITAMVDVLVVITWREVVNKA